MDNASNKKTCMQKLETLLHMHDIEFDTLDCLVMCFPHVMHICMTHVIKSFTDDELTSIANTWIGVFPDEDEHKAYVEAVRLDPITMGHDIVWIIQASGLHRDEFLDTVKTGNMKNWFKGPMGEAEQVPGLELLHDVKTHWDSTYAMINRLHALHLAVNYFLALPNQKELKDYILSSPQWLVLEDFEHILQVGSIQINEFQS
ncbi:hypothetical protein PAXRUDRAFT_170763 [Paxillus rubicundulus Ve08.2h10]|uniref:Uncharacterized protein n=1 Tax=Paxillus rubicundulus Ve08.2h10 TaxID=930991 RepID=A0A0D0D7C2_9AGAM|nr:hypothetical protein PAXRUDRAFT_170763 [Paxillus rubicundulus Ve08.2h10]